MGDFRFEIGEIYGNQKKSDQNPVFIQLYKDDQKIFKLQLIIHYILRSMM